MIANAGVYGPRESFRNADPKAWEESLFANIFGLSRTCRASIPLLSASGRGQILVIGSAIGHGQATGSTAYALSKAMGWSVVQCPSLELDSVGLALNLSLITN